MGNKIHPEGFRIGVSKDWRTHWYAEGKERIKNVLEDKKIRLFLKDKLSSAGLSRIEIERSISALKVTVFVSRPGVVIGRGGAGTTALRDAISNITKSKVELAVETIKDYERFNIDENKNSLKNASTQSAGAVPEPHEWALIIILALTMMFLYYKRRFNINSL